VVGHASFAGHCEVQAEAYRLGPGERFVLMASLTFDASLDQIAATLVSGATVLVVDPRAVTPDRLVDVLSAAGATGMDITPAYFRELVAVLRPGDGRLSALRLMSVGGDVVRFDDVHRWRAAGRTSTFASMYGPTEATIGCTIFTVTDADLATAGADDNVPIGRPLPGTGAYVLDADQRPVPVGVVGELYIGGDRVAQGYRHAPALTADRFLPDPFRDRPGARMYRTGDLVRPRPDGALTFVGRADNQVKIRGFRVELGEIEAALAAHPSVHAAVVTVGEPRPGDRRIAAYVVPVGALGEVDPADLAAHVRARLPEYMVPSAWLVLDALPLTPNNKVDRRALPAPDWSRSEAAGDYVAPDGPVEEIVAAVWAEVLGLDRVGAHDDFFSVGGNSLLGMRMLLRLTEEFDLDLPLRTIFEERTVAKLAAVVLAALIAEDRP
jgi:acyl-coenzyme A synthetase/AMP-(fatty) acid ligase/acyl carrier protein